MSPTGQEVTLQVNLHSWVTGLAGRRKLFPGSPKPFEVAAVRLARKGLMSFF